MPYQSTWNNPYLHQQYQAYQQPQYQPQYQQQYQPSQPQQGQYQQPQYQQSVNGIIKVNGRDSAMQYQLPPNSTSVPLIDSSFDGKKGIFYVVSTDGTGTKSIEAYDFTPHVDANAIEIDGAQFVSRDEFDDFARKVNAVIGAFDGSHGPVREPASGIPADAAVRQSTAPSTKARAAHAAGERLDS